MKRERPSPLGEVIRDPAEAVRLLSSDTVIGLDLETGGLSPWHDPIAVVSMFGEDSGRTAVVHVRGSLPPVLKRFLSSKGPLFVGHNIAGFDLLFLANAGVDVFVPKYFDSLIGEQMTLSSGRRDVRVSLQDSVARRLGVRLKKGMGTSPWMADELTEEQLQYCVEDVFYLPKVMQAQRSKVQGLPQGRAMDFEQDLVPIVVRMVLNGLPLDQDMLDVWTVEMYHQEALARRTIDELLGPGTNVNSSLQLRRALLDRLGVDVESTDAETLQALSEDEGPVGEAAKAVSLARRALKRTGMYDDDWVAKYCHGGRVHSSFWQTSVDTFRMSSSDPSLQQIPVDGRKIFGGLEGHMIVSVDYAQLEVRVAAAIARDKGMIAALDSTDIHSTVAASIFHCPLTEVTKAQRKLAKAATFTLLFGGSATGLVRYAKLSGSHLEVEEAQQIVRSFFSSYTGIAAARQRANAAGRQGTPVTLTLPNGARRVLAPHLGTVRPSQILNTMVQGSAAIGLKYALFEAERRGLTKYLGAAVHDELVATVPEQEAEDYRRELEGAMVVGMAKILGDVPVGVEGKVGTHWS